MHIDYYDGTVRNPEITRPSRIWVAVAIVCGLMAAGCSTDVEPFTPLGEIAASASSSALPNEAGFSVLGSLAQIPLSAADDAESPLEVSVGDLDAAADQARLRRPLDASDSKDLVDFFAPLIGAARSDMPPRLFVPLPRLFADGAILGIEEFVDEVGFSPGDITTFVALESPPAEFVVVAGVAPRSGLPEVAPGVGTIGQGEDFSINLQERTAARPLGRPIRVAERDGLVALSRATDPLVDWVGDTPASTLADNDVLARVASRLDEESVVSAFLATSDETVYEGVGVGWQAEAEPRGVIVLTYSSEAAAREQLSLVEAAFDGESLASDLLMPELVTVDAVDVRGSEIVVTMRFPDDRPPVTILNLLFRSDVPFALPG